MIPDEVTKICDGCFWNPPSKYVFKSPRPVESNDASLRIYETHVGIARLEPRCHTYREFEKDILRMVVDLGYNAIQVMAIMEHVDYSSFGYQVTNFFTVSSRFGTPDDLKRMIDTAHSLGVKVFLDLIHSHASTNVDDEINQFDGTDYYYFHEGSRVYYDLWNVRLFNYQHIEVERFLLSNLKYFLEEFHFDGFKFDGVASIIY
jgi:1,4-alpha-glucan branching enzyme